MGKMLSDRRRGKGKGKWEKDCGAAAAGKVVGRENEERTGKKRDGERGISGWREGWCGLPCGDGWRRREQGKERLWRGCSCPWGLAAAAPF